MKIIEANINEHNNWKIVENEIKNINFEGLFITFCELYFNKINTPVQEMWYGIIHNPCEWENYSPWYDNTNLFELNVFVESLRFCKLLFVMSKTQIIPIKELLKKKGYKIDVINLYHPINKLNFSFDFEKYTNNSKKTIFSIGNWLRKQYSIFKLQCDAKFNKAILPFTKRTQDELSFYINRDHIVITDEEFKSVLKIEKLDDFNYHKIFEKNLVFLDVYLTTINNTFLECLISNTPILLNRHQEYVELIGETYPLFYDSLDDIKYFIFNDENILNAHNYLKKVDKTRFTLDYFIKDLNAKLHFFCNLNEQDKQLLIQSSC